MKISMKAQQLSAKLKQRYAGKFRSTAPEDLEVFHKFYSQAYPMDDLDAAVEVAFVVCNRLNTADQIVKFAQDALDWEPKKEVAKVPKHSAKKSKKKVATTKKPGTKKRF